MLCAALRLKRSTKLQLTFSLLLLGSTSFAQPEPIESLDISSTTTDIDGTNTLLKHYIFQVDSLSRTSGIASHFARIYTASISNFAFQLERMDSGAQHFIKKFEISFISYFLGAAFEFEKNGHLPTQGVWNCYFSKPKTESWQLTLIGVNAHINGDIWKGLVNSFSEQEIRRYKKNLLSFQRSISKVFQPFFDDLMMQSSYLRFMNGFTKGTARIYGEWLIY